MKKIQMNGLLPGSGLGFPPVCCCSCPASPPPPSEAPAAASVSAALEPVTWRESLVSSSAITM